MSEIVESAARLDPLQTQGRNKFSKVHVDVYLFQDELRKQGIVIPDEMARQVLAQHEDAISRTGRTAMITTALTLYVASRKVKR